MICVIAFFGAVKGLISTFPLISFSLTYLDDSKGQNEQRKVYLLIFITVLIFLCLMFILWPVSGGLQWGARYLLLAQPFLLYLALYVYGEISQIPNRSWQAKFRATTMTLVALSIVLQLLSVYLLHKSRSEQLATQQFVNSLEADIILTNVGHASSFLASISDKHFLYVRDEADLAIVLQALAENEIEKVAVVSNKSLIIPQSVENVTIEQISEFVYRLENNTENLRNRH